MDFKVIFYNYIYIIIKYKVYIKDFVFFTPKILIVICNL